MSQADIKEIFKLSKDEKINLVQFLWDNISSESNSINLIPSQIEELDRRMVLFEKGETNFKTWDEVKFKYMNLN